MKISVIISVYNQPAFLDLVLHGFRHQTDSDFGVIVADDGSGPGVANVIARHQEHQPYALHHVWHEDDGYRRYAIMNRAIAESDADYLIFTDGDCIPKPNLIAVHRRISRPRHYVTGACVRLSRATTQRITHEAVISGKVFDPLWLAFNEGWKNYRTFKPNFFVPESIGLQMDRISGLRVSYGRFTAANSSCFREDALAIDGFNEKMVYGGGDYEFGIRLQNNGIKPIRLKTASSTLHLDHDRPYKNHEGVEANKHLIEAARNSGATSWR